MPYSQEAKILAKMFTQRMREVICCQVCGKQPIEFHRDEHQLPGYLQVSQMTALGYPIDRIAEEILLCTPLCRSCHMKLDGRSDRLQQSKPLQKGTVLPSQRCIECGELAKPLRKGLCNRCNQKRRYRADDRMLESKRRSVARQKVDKLIEQLNDEDANTLLRKIREVLEGGANARY